jgi:F0F1-type ATP synthase membrane subunit b/b'
MLIDWFTVGAQVINFLVLVWLLKRFLYRPILDAIDAREQRIAAELADADARRAEARQERESFQHKNQEFDQQRAALFAHAMDEAKSERRRLLDETRQAADAMRAKRQEALRQEAEQLNQALLSRTQREVFAIARKTLTDLAGASLDARLVDVLIERLGRWRASRTPCLPRGRHHRQRLHRHRQGLRTARRRLRGTARFPGEVSASPSTSTPTKSTSCCWATTAHCTPAGGRAHRPRHGRGGGRWSAGPRHRPAGPPAGRPGAVATSQRLPIERPAAAIMDRAPVTVPLQTGLKVIDALIPIGRGQRELILGDRQTGKTAIAIDTILNQRGTGVLCVYCAIGQRGSAVAKTVATLREQGALAYTVVVVAEGNDAPGLAYIAPYAATSIAEHFMEQGRDVLIVYDDLTHHARAYRELSLLLRRPPGREAFPGRHLLHPLAPARARHPPARGRGGGSLTALPIIETEAQNISAYIPTNLISITDGQIYLSPSLFALGVLPAVDVGVGLARGRQGAARGLPRGGGRPEAGLRAVRGTGDLRPLRRPLDEDTRQSSRTASASAPAWARRSCRRCRCPRRSPSCWR